MSLAPVRRFTVGIGTYISFCVMCVIIGSLLLTIMVTLTIGGIVSVGGLVMTMSALATIAIGAMAVIVKLGQWQEHNSRRISALEDAVAGLAPSVCRILERKSESDAWAAGYVEGCRARSEAPFDGPPHGS